MQDDVKLMGCDKECEWERKTAAHDDRNGSRVFVSKQQTTIQYYTKRRDMILGVINIGQAATIKSRNTPKRRKIPRLLIITFGVRACDCDYVCVSVDGRKKKPEPSDDFISR